ncbi:hypothetical protein HK405_009663, partial [Cladochytrium tenue]
MESFNPAGGDRYDNTVMPGEDFLSGSYYDWLHTLDCSHQAPSSKPPTEISPPAAPMPIELPATMSTANSVTVTTPSSSGVPKVAAIRRSLNKGNGLKRAGMTGPLLQSRSSAANRSTTPTLHSTMPVPAVTSISPVGDRSQPPAVNAQGERVCAHELEPVEPEEADMEGPEGTKKYRCTHPGCNKEIAGLWNAKNHRRTVHSSDPHKFSCELCLGRYKRKGDLKRHLVTSKHHTNGEKFHCAKCECCYLRKSDL